MCRGGEERGREGGNVCVGEGRRGEGEGAMLLVRGEGEGEYVCVNNQLVD